jgi:hypothetical protein
VSEHFRYEMGYTEHEFAQVLKGRFSGPASVYRCEEIGRLNWILRHVNDPIEVKVRIEQAEPRQLGNLKLPVLKVAFSLEQHSEASRTAFFDKFFKYFHKGGG